MDAVVVPPSSVAAAYMQAFAPSGTVPSPSGALLYVAQTDFDSPTTVSVSEVVDSPGAYRGEVLEIEASGAMTHTSVQETVLHSTACGDEAFPVKEACSPLPTDVLVHSGVVWAGDVASESDVLIVAGASAHEQDTPATTGSGEYRLAGEVVSGAEIAL